MRQTTINVIGTKYQQNPNRSLIDILEKWLNRADDVDKKGYPSWETLAKALRELGCIAVAEGIEIEKGML